MNNPQAGKWLFRAVSILAPVGVMVLFELQSQLDSGGALAWRPLASSLIGAVLVAYAHFARAGTEHAEIVAEVATGVDQDADNTVEQPEGGVRWAQATNHADAVITSYPPTNTQIGTSRSGNAEIITHTDMDADNRVETEEE